MRPEDFSGGNATVVPVLRSLGFNLEFAQNPDWSRDELLLALDLYLSTRTNPQRQLELLCAADKQHHQKLQKQDSRRWWE